MLNVAAVLPEDAELGNVFVPDLRETVNVFPGAGIVVERKARIEIDRRRIRNAKTRTRVRTATAEAGVRNEIERIVLRFKLANVDAGRRAALHFLHIGGIYEAGALTPIGVSCRKFIDNGRSGRVCDAYGGVSCRRAVKIRRPPFSGSAEPGRIRRTFGSVAHAHGVDEHMQLLSYVVIH